jgi:AbrB family looped-hinge helix DNA binding protein
MREAVSPAFYCLGHSTYKDGQDMTATSTISSKGQITIPAAYRKLLDLGPGSRVEFDVDVRQGCIVLTKAADFDVIAY